MGLRPMFEGADLDPVRLAISSLHVVTGCLFFFREPLKAEAPRRFLAAALPSLLCAGLVFKLAGPATQWPRGAIYLFVAATAFTVISLVCLGRAFALLPGFRSLVARGPYALVRHPAYLGELAMVSACAWAGFARGGEVELWLPILLAVLLPALVLRILAEERVCGLADSYRAYQQRVHWRLVPGLW